MPMKPAASEGPVLGVVVIGGDDGGVETGRSFPPVDEISCSGRRCREFLQRFFLVGDLECGGARSVAI